MNDNDTKSKKVKTLMIVIFIIVIVSTSLYVGYENNIFKKDDEKNNTSLDENKRVISNGIYRLENVTIKIYKVSPVRLAYFIEADNNKTNGIYLIKKDDTSINIDNLAEIIFYDNMIEVVSSIANIPSGKYTKIGELDKEKLYSENYGNLEYLNSIYNGTFSSNNATIYLYQIDENTVKVKLRTDTSILEKEFIINNNGTLYVNDSDDLSMTYLITIQEKKLKFETIKDSENKIFDGEYTFVHHLNVMDIEAIFDFSI